MESYNKVFISYAKEDLEVANRLFDYLVKSGFEPWLDKRKLLPGQNWDYEIKKALKESDYIILLLSSVSVAKRGYVQREYKLALQYYEEKLESDIYIIPCKINECEVPDSLSKFHWIEVYNRGNDEEYSSIIDALGMQQLKYLNAYNLTEILNTPFEYKEIEIKESIKDILPYTEIEISYPQFLHTNNLDLKVLNSKIENIFLTAYSEFKLYSTQSFFSEENELILEKDRLANAKNNLYMTYNFSLLSESLISFYVWEHSFNSTAAHPYLNISGHSYSLDSLEQITIKKLFEDDDNALKTLYQICDEKLKDEALDREIISNREEVFMVSENYHSIQWETYDNFHLTKSSIIVIFYPCYAIGYLIISIDFDEILSIHPNLKVLNKIKCLCNKLNS